MASPDPSPIREGFDIVRAIVQSYQENPTTRREDVDSQIAELRHLIETTYAGQPKPREIAELTEELDVMAATVDSLAQQRLGGGSDGAHLIGHGPSSEAAAMAAAMHASMSGSGHVRGNIIRSPRTIEQCVYNDRMFPNRQPKLESVGAQFSQILPVRGEGNCYYRSFYMSALLNNRPHVLTKAIEQFRSSASAEDQARFPEDKVKTLEIMLHEMSMLSPHDLAAQLADPDHPFDEEMVSFLRAYAAQSLEQAPHDHAVWGAVEYDAANGETQQTGMQKFVRDEVLQPESYASGPVISMMHERMGVNVPIIIYNADKPLFETGNPDLDHFGVELGEMDSAKEPDFYLYQSGGATSGHYDVPIMRANYGFDIGKVTQDLQRLEKCAKDSSKTFEEAAEVRSRLQASLPPLNKVSGDQSYVNSVIRAYRLVDHFSTQIEARCHQNFAPFLGTNEKAPLDVERIPKDIEGTKFEGMDGELLSMIRDFESTFSQLLEDPAMDQRAATEILTNFAKAIGDKANHTALTDEQREYVEQFVSAKLHATKKFASALLGQKYSIDIEEAHSMSTDLMQGDSLEPLAYRLEMMREGEPFDTIYRLTHTLNVAFSADMRSRVIELYNANGDVDSIDSPDDRAKPISHPELMRRAVMEAVRERVHGDVYGDIYASLGENDRGEGMGFGQNHLFDGHWRFLSDAIKARGARIEYLSD